MRGPCGHDTTALGAKRVGSWVPSSKKIVAVRPDY